MAKQHIVVIGAGAFGSWTAYHLRQMNVDVTLLDTWGPGNGRSSSGGESRIIRSVYGADEIYVKAVRRSFELWKHFEQEWQASIYEPTGSLWLLPENDTYLKGSMPLLEKYNFSLDEWTLDQTKQRYPQINLEGIKKVYFEKEAGLLHARKACRAVVKAFIKNGGTYQQATVKQVVNKQTIELSTGQKIDADRFVFCCGPWLKKLFPTLLDPYLTISKQEIYYFGTPSGTSAFHCSDLPIWLEMGKEIMYGIPATSERGFKIANDTRKEAFDPDTSDRTPTLSEVNTAKKFIQHRFPKMGLAPLLESRVCQYTNSPDGHFIIDRHPDFDQVIIAGAGCGHAFKMGPAIGAYLAELALDKLPVNPFFALARFSDGVKRSTQFDVD